MEFKAGQVWRSRSGRLATIAEVDVTKPYPIFARLEGVGTTTFSKTGRLFKGQDSGADLMELVGNTITPLMQDTPLSSQKAPVPHIHAALIKQWADGAKIQVMYLNPNSDWVDCVEPIWSTKCAYRVKPTSVFNVACRSGSVVMTFLTIEAAKASPYWNEKAIGILEYTGDDVLFHKKEQ